MIEYENECVWCPEDMGCLGTSCKYVNVPHLYCDECGDEDDVLYEYQNMCLCTQCFLEKYERKIKVQDI